MRRREVITLLGGARSSLQGLLLFTLSHRQRQETT
jgi:hypothetical protein